MNDISEAGEVINNDLDHSKQASKNTQYEEFTIWTLFNQLIRRRFPVSLDDYEALRIAMRAGFGWQSRQDLRELCCALWAKSQQERATLLALFDQLPLPDWKLPDEASSKTSDPTLPDVSNQAEKEKASAATEEAMEEESFSISISQFTTLPRISLANVQTPKRPIILTPQFPLTHREVAQAFRRLRIPEREGPLVELDIEATIDQRSRKGIASPIVLRARRRNRARLLMFVDRQGSMTPYHRFVANVCNAIEQSGRLEKIKRYYFHNVPVESADIQILEQLSGQLFPEIDSILPEIKPLFEGNVALDPELLFPVLLSHVFTNDAHDASVILISDAGAARGRRSTERLLNTVAFLKALRHYSRCVVWLNPLPQKYWHKSTAAQIARHIPMFPLDRPGMYRAVDVLRGHSYSVAKEIQLNN